MSYSWVSCDEFRHHHYLNAGLSICYFVVPQRHISLLYAFFSSLSNACYLSLHHSAESTIDVPPASFRSETALHTRRSEIRQFARWAWSHKNGDFPRLPARPPKALSAVREPAKPRHPSRRTVEISVPIPQRILQSSPPALTTQDTTPQHQGYRISRLHHSTPRSQTSGTDY